ncbi:MAG: hypothetical protein ACM3MG_03230 [Bacillota bacterium]
MKKIILLFLICAPFFAEAKCKIAISQIESITRRIQWRNEEGLEDNTALIRADAEGEFGSDGSADILEYEAFVRPDNDGTFQVLPLPLFMVEMEKNRDSIYICAHVESKNPANMQILVYFLRNGQVKPVTPVPLPLSEIKNLFWGPLRKTPFVVVGIPVTITQKIQTLLVHIFGDLTRVGVDRVRITNKQLQLYSGGDPAQFEHYVFRQNIPLEESN